MSQQKPLKQTQIALGVIVKQNQEMDLPNQEQPFSLLYFIDKIIMSFESSKTFDENTVALTQADLEEKLKMASGKTFNTNEVIREMNNADFQMQFISNALITPDFYWLLQPKKVFKI
jgi:hypothetical protein